MTKKWKHVNNVNDGINNESVMAAGMAAGIMILLFGNDIVINDVM